jgi:hypothetical protein
MIGSAGVNVPAAEAYKALAAAVKMLPNVEKALKLAKRQLL